MSLYPHAEQLNAAQQKNDADKGRPAVSRTLPDQFPDGDNDDCQKGNQTEHNTKYRGQQQRDGRKRDDAVNGIQKQFPRKTTWFHLRFVRYFEIPAIWYDNPPS